MSGHSKWSTIKRKKGAADARRGKIFSKLAKEIQVAARLGGGDPEMNPRLRTVLLAARAANMPKDNVEKAITKGTGASDSESYEEVRYEGYGPGGVAIIVDVLTDNKNRTVADIRHALTKHGGSMAELGAVTWNFEQRGYIVLPGDAGSEDDIFLRAAEAGADDVKAEGDAYEIYTDPHELHAVAVALESFDLKPEEARLNMIPKTTTQVAGSHAKQVLKIMEMLEDLDDVQHVYANFDIEDEEMALLTAE